MHLLRRIFIVLWKSWFIIVFATISSIFFPVFSYFFGQKHRNLDLLGWWVRLACKTICVLSGLIWRIHNKNNFPKPPYIITPNHTSYLDILISVVVFPHDFAFMGKAELVNWPFIGPFFKHGIYIPVNRSSLSDSHRAFVKAGIELDKGRCIVIFPEATIPKHVPRLRSFKNGAFKLAIEKHLPIVPVTFADNYRRLQNGGFLKAPASPGRVKVVIHPPEDTHLLGETDIETLKERVKSQIEKGFDES
ncbi:MAG: 1-acyl-sn-glycerol-3-phosphate acyltransferase [Flavobacteriales bacterium]|nr:1-acyl-sn-glycerol-3-phosphate acyltransferase [Flavobacteriales bacterium]